MSIISGRGITKQYKDVKALDDVDISVEAGAILGIVGPNGAGKTTLLRALLGLCPVEGNLEVLGRDPFRQRPELMRETSFIADVGILPRWMPVDALIDHVDALHPAFDRGRAEELLARTDVRLKTRVKNLSKGMLAQLHLAIVMAIDARLLVLDEPTLGLDIIYRERFFELLLNDYWDERRSIVLSTHEVREVEHILTHVMFIHHGRVALHMEMEELAARFVQITVAKGRLEDARALGPLKERERLGRHEFLFEGLEIDANDLGEVQIPSLADIFVAKLEDRPA